MTKDNDFILIMCVALIWVIETIKRQENDDIKSCNNQIEAIQRFLEAKFPPSDSEKMTTLRHVLDFGHKLQDALKGMKPEDRSLAAFALYDFSNHSGVYVPNLTL